MLFSDEAELARRLTEHDPNAMEALYVRFQPSLFRWALSRSFQPPDAEDLVHNTMLLAIEGIEHYDPSRPLKDWVMGIERNLMRRVWETRKTQPTASIDQIVDDAPDQHFIPVAEPIPSATLEASDAWRAEHWRRIQLHLATMKGSYALALELRYMQDASYEQIAMALNLKNAASARVYVNRGLVALRKLIASVLPEESPKSTRRDEK